MNAIKAGEGSTALTLTVAEQYALVPNNPHVQAIARRLRWKPETTIRRIRQALPAVIEQQIYLAISPERGESGILPESMAKLLRLYLGHQKLQLNDLAPDSSGRTRFINFAEFLGACITLLKIITGEYSAFALSIEHAGLIVLNYGTDDPELLIEMVDCNLEAMCEVLDISNSIPYGERMRICVGTLVGKVIPDNQERGMPDVLDLADFLTMSSTQRQGLRRLISQELPDYLSADAYEMRGYDTLVLLKELELI